MVEVPQRQNSPYLHHQLSPLSHSLLLGEQRAADANQTVPISPSLSPLAKTSLKRSNSATSLLSVNRPPLRYSPTAALVPECSNTDRVFSGSPLLRQILKAGRKRQLESSPDSSPPSYAGQSTPSPIATSSKRFCSHCSSVYTDGMVVLSRKKVPRKPASSLNQVVPSCSPVAEEYSSPPPEVVTTNKGGVKELFADSDIFVRPED